MIKGDGKSVSPTVQISSDEERNGHMPVHHFSFIWRVLSIFFLIVITFTICGKIFAFTVIEGSSMEPNISGFLIGNRLAYEKREPQRGDVILFHYEGKALVKRIVGMPGENVEINGGVVFIDGKILDEPYLPEGTITDAANLYDTVPDGMYFVLGDNRDVSYDSRYFPMTYVDRRDIIARAIYVINKFPGHFLERYTDTDAVQDGKLVPSDDSSVSG